MRRVHFSGEWADLLGSVEDAKGAAELTRETYQDGTHDSGFYMRFFRADQDDSLQLAFQIQHDVLVPGEARFHLHLLPMATPVLDTSDIVRWKYYYTLVTTDAETPRNIASWTSSSVSKQLAVTCKFKHVIHSIFTATLPAGTPASSFLLVQIVRPGNTDAADTYSVDKDAGTAKANLACLGLDVHVQRARAGTRGEFS